MVTTFFFERKMYIKLTRFALIFMFICLLFFVVLPCSLLNIQQFDVMKENGCQKLYHTLEAKKKSFECLTIMYCSKNTCFRSR